MNSKEKFRKLSDNSDNSLVLLKNRVRSVFLVKINMDYYH